MRKTQADNIISAQEQMDAETKEPKDLIGEIEIIKKATHFVELPVVAITEVSMKKEGRITITVKDFPPAFFDEIKTLKKSFVSLLLFNPQTTITGAQAEVEQLPGATIEK